MLEFGALTYKQPHTAKVLLFSEGIPKHWINSGFPSIHFDFNNKGLALCMILPFADSDCLFSI